jgi:hypothetical protein
MDGIGTENLDGLFWSLGLCVVLIVYQWVKARQKR